MSATSCLHEANALQNHNRIAQRQTSVSTKAFTARNVHRSSFTTAPVRRHSERFQPLGARRPRDPIIAPVVPLGPDGEDATDMMGYLFRNRIIFVGSRINDQVATSVVASLLALEALDPEEEIKMYINSAGGQAYSIIAILDTMKHIKNPISTVAFGAVASTATLLLAAGTKGRRFSMPNTRIMIHQPGGGAMGSADEVNIQATELNRTMKVMHAFLSEFTGLPTERVEEETDRDNFLNPNQALELGIIDAVV